MYTVTRQIQWPEGRRVVEVSQGGLDCTNPDALSPKYPGEFREYDDPREAVEAAIAICEAWRRDGAPDAEVGFGATGGMTMPFDPTSYQEARAWASRVAEQLPRCDRCGRLLPARPYHYQGIDDEQYCSEWCAEFANEDREVQDGKDSGVCDSCRMVAYDDGIQAAYQQGMVMIELGADLEDHLCDAREESGAEIVCHCGCNSRERR